MKPILIFLLFCLATITHAQTNTKGYVAMTVGGSVPLGEFSDGPGSAVLPSRYENFPGFALVGYELNAQGGYFINQYIGIGAKLAYNTFWTGDKRLAIPGQGPLSGTVATYGTSTYNSIAFLIGPRFRVNASDDVELFAMPLVGFDRFTAADWSEKTTPGSTYFNPLMQTNLIDLVKMSYSNQLLYGLTAGLKTRGKVSFLVELSYMDLGRRNAQITAYTSSNNGQQMYSQTTRWSVSQTISWVSLNAGICVGF